MNNPSIIPEPTKDLLDTANLVREACLILSQATNSERVNALDCIAEALSLHSNEIVRANQLDIKESESNGISKALIARLKLDKDKLNNSIEGVKQVSLLNDPIGIRQLHTQLDDRLDLERVTVPLGVIGVIFEARPDAVIQIASLAVRSGNGAILKGGSEALRTNESIIKAIKIGLKNSSISPQSIALLTTRKESLSLLKLNGMVDLIIPRGSNELVNFIQKNTLIPVLGHADGICHLFVDHACDLKKAIKIAIDSKTHYPAACNTIETLLVHRKIASEFLKYAIPEFSKLNVELRGDIEAVNLGVQNHAQDHDWKTEYLDLILSIKIVNSIDEAINHIRSYGSRHTDAIVTDDISNANKFLSSVDSSGVFLNCSTRFADGYRYGFGAEVGISTQTLPPRGPVGLEGLVTYRYILRGDGHVASDYTQGKNSFTHKKLAL